MALIKCTRKNRNLLLVGGGWKVLKKGDWGKKGKRLYPRPIKGGELLHEPSNRPEEGS